MPITGYLLHHQRRLQNIGVLLFRSFALCCAFANAFALTFACHSTKLIKISHIYNIIYAIYIYNLMYLSWLIYLCRDYLTLDVGIANAGLWSRTLCLYIYYCFAFQSRRQLFNLSVNSFVALQSYAKSFSCFHSRSYFSGFIFFFIHSFQYVSLK